MGRGELNMELIKKPKLRKVTYKKRKEGLVKKMHEFTTLCDVNACMIIYPNEDDSLMPETWPENNPEEVRQLISLYKNKGKESGGSRIYRVKDFLKDRTKQMEGKLTKLRERNGGIKYPIWFDFMDGLSEKELRDFGDSLEEKMHNAKNLIDSISTKLGQPEAEVGTSNQHVHPIETVAEAARFDHVHQSQSINDNPLMIFLVNEKTHEHGLQFGSVGGGLSNAGVHAASFQRPVYYEQRGGAAENVAHKNNVWPLAGYYGPILPSLPTYAPMQWAAPRGVSVQLLPWRENQQGHDVMGHGLQNPKAWL